MNLHSPKASRGRLLRNRAFFTLPAVLLAVLGFAPPPAAAQEPAYQWAGGFIPDASTSGFSQTRAVATDGSGNVYTVGLFSGTVDFDPGTGTQNLTSSGSTDNIFISKLDAGGNYVWAKSMGGTGYDAGYGIAVDGSGHVYTTGYFSGTADFDPGTGTQNLTSAGAADIFISKLDAGGNYVWAKSLGGTGDDAGYGIAVDGSGHVYTTGLFSRTADFDPGTGTQNLTSSGNYDIFISKLDASGNYVWAKSMGGTGFDYALGIAVDGSGHVYTIGYFSRTVDFDPGTGTQNLTSSGNTNDIFISKLDAGGNYVWAKSLGGTGNDYGYGIAVDGSGHVYTTGVFSRTVDFDPGTGTQNLTSSGNTDDIFISKLDAGGNYVWAKSMGGTSYDAGYGIAVDGSGHVYTTGFFSGTADFDPGTGTQNLTNSGNYDIFISKLDAGGNYVWAKSMGGTDYDYALGIALYGSGHVYTTGFFSGTVDFDPGTGTQNLTSAGGGAGFVLKLSQGPTCPTPSATVAAVAPAGSAYTGGNAANIYLGYGAQSATLQTTVGANSGTGLTYSWSPSSNLSSPSAASPVFTPNASGTALHNYTVTVSNAEGCSTQADITICVKDIRVPASPGSRGQRFYACGGSTGTQMLYAAQLPQFISAANPGNSLGQCGQSCGSTARMGNGGEGEEGDSIADMVAGEALAMVVYPNPSASSFTLRIESAAGEEAELRIVDLSGRTVERLGATPTNVEVSIGAKLSPGIYFVEARSGSAVKMMKVVKL